MTAFTDVMENEILNRYLKNTTALTPAATTYLALGTAGSDSAFTEVSTSGTNYARKAATWGTVSGGSVSNSGAHTYNQSTAAWGTITHVAVFDAVSGGNRYFWATLSVPVVINSGDTFEFASGQVTVTLS